jgi:hypothetical protein
LCRCIERKYGFQYTFEAAINFRNANKNLPRFSYIDIVEGHEPTQRVIRGADASFPQFITDIMSDERTILVLTSDHGVGDRGQSPTVKVEERIPLSMLVTPKGFTSQEMRDALARNQKRIITAVDMFETVARIPRRYATGRPLEEGPGVRPWAQSLWSDVKDRSCLEAGVGKNACACTQYRTDNNNQVPPLRW